MRESQTGGRARWLDTDEVLSSLSRAPAFPAAPSASSLHGSGMWMPSAAAAYVATWAQRSVSQRYSVNRYENGGQPSWPPGIHFSTTVGTTVGVDTGPLKANALPEQHRAPQQEAKIAR